MQYEMNTHSFMPRAVHTSALQFGRMSQQPGQIRAGPAKTRTPHPNALSGLSFANLDLTFIAGTLHRIKPQFKHVPSKKQMLVGGLRRLPKSCRQYFGRNIGEKMKKNKNGARLNACAKRTSNHVSKVQVENRNIAGWSSVFFPPVNYHPGGRCR